MKRVFMFLPLLFLGCAVSENATNIKNRVTQFAKCYVHKVPAPFWVCYETSFSSIGKVHTQNLNRLAEQEAYAVGIKSLSEKILLKTKLFLKKLNYKDKTILKKVKSFVIMNAVEDGVWFDKKNKILYVRVSLNEDEFKKFLFSQLKGYDKKVLEVAFDESF